MQIKYLKSAFGIFSRFDLAPPRQCWVCCITM